MKRYLTNLKYLIPLWILLLIVFIIAWEHQGCLIIDCGREVYYSEKILDGKILYKDLFNIYGPFSYMFNALLYKIFGISLNVIYIAGMFVATGIVTLVYLISRLFFDKLLSSVLTFFTIIIGCFSFYIFNFVFTYSFAMTYGLLAFLASLYCLILFVKTNNTKLYYLSSFLAGIAVFSKYEFILYTLAFIWVEYKLKFDWKRVFKASLSFILLPLLVMGLLFLQGLTIGDVFRNFKDVYAMTRSQTLKYFYIVSGLIFQKETPGLLIRNFLKTMFPLGLIFGSFYFYNRKKIIATSFFIAAIVATAFLTSVESLVFAPVLLFILTFIYFKKVNLEVQVLTMSALLVSLKVFWSTVTNFYGVFFIPILLIAILCFVKRDFRKQVAVYLLILGCTFAFQNFSERIGRPVEIKSERGAIYDYMGYKDNAQKLIDYLKFKTKPTDKVVILPEGLFINFLADRNSDDYYNTLLPLYFETFGDKRITSYFEKNKPEYFVLLNSVTPDYYFKSICIDYGFDFCNFVQKSYKPKALINGVFKAYIFEVK